MEVNNNEQIIDNFRPKILLRSGTPGLINLSNNGRQETRSWLKLYPGTDKLQKIFCDLLTYLFGTT